MLHHFGQFDGSFTLKVVMETKHVAVSWKVVPFIHIDAV